MTVGCCELVPLGMTGWRRDLVPLGMTDDAASHLHAVALDVLAEVQVAVEAGDLLGVAVEGQGLAAGEIADPTFGGLTPAGVIDVWVHVGVEAVLARGLHRPGGLGLLGGEADLDDRLDALEAVLPGD